MEKLFSKFDRIEETRNRNIEGTGLGLSITKGLLEMMGSTLVVNSVYGAGSEFSFAIKQTVVKWEPLGDFEEARKLLTDLARNTNYFQSNRYVTDLASGEICAAIGYSGDFIQVILYLL